MSGEAPRPKGPDDKKPILMGLIALLGLLVMGVFADKVLGSAPDVPTAPVSLHGQASDPVSALPIAPAGLQDAIEQFARREAGRNGVLVRSVEDEWIAGFRGATTFPQGSLRRIWLGAALLDAVDRGELRLDQRVPLLAVSRKGQQPREQVGELLRRAVEDDDRQAQDHILDGLNGSQGMARWLEEKEIEEVVYGPAYRDLAKSRERNGKAGAQDPADGATPDGMAFGLSQLFAGKLLSGNSSRLLLSFFTGQPTPAGQGAEPGWNILRMTGETASNNGRPLAASGAALVRSRTGRRFVVTVFADGSADATGRCDRLLNGAVSAIEVRETR